MNERAKDGNGDGSGDGAGTGTGMGVETQGRPQDENGDGSGDGNENSSGDGNRDGNEDGTGEGGGEAGKCKRPHKSCRRDQALLFRTRHHLCRQEVALAGAPQLRSEELVPIHAHRTEGVTASKGRERSNVVGSGIGIGGGNVNGD